MNAATARLVHAGLALHAHASPTAGNSRLRPVQPASRATPLAAITDDLVEATDTLDSVLRKHLPATGG